MNAPSAAVSTPLMTVVAVMSGVLDEVCRVTGAIPAGRSTGSWGAAHAGVSRTSKSRGPASGSRPRDRSSGPLSAHSAASVSQGRCPPRGGAAGTDHGRGLTTKHPRMMGRRPARAQPPWIEVAGCLPGHVRESSRCVRLGLMPELDSAGWSAIDAGPPARQAPHAWRAPSTSWKATHVPVVGRVVLIAPSACRPGRFARVMCTNGPADRFSGHPVVEHVEGARGMCGAEQPAADARRRFARVVGPTSAADQGHEADTAESISRRARPAHPCRPGTAPGPRSGRWG